MGVYQSTSTSSAFHSSLTVLLFVLACGCRPAPQQCVFAGETQGTTYTVKVVAQSVSRGQESAIRQAIGDRLARIDETMSTYRPDSEISRFNRFEEATPFQVSPELIEVFSLAIEVSEASQGAFDITVAPLVEAWGFGPDKKSRRAPTDEELATLRARVGYEKIAVDPARATLRKILPGVHCNLNAIAQGYTADKLAADLDRLGCSSYMVEVGGEIKAKGRNARGAPWRIGIEKPIATARAIQRVISLDNRALSTSGDYRNYYEKDGVRVSHTIDPKTGRPITHALASVSVIHDSCALADAYATALMVLGPDKGYDLAVKLNLPALFIVHQGGDAFSEKPTPSFPSSEP